MAQGRLLPVSQVAGAAVSTVTGSELTGVLVGSVRTEGLPSSLLIGLRARPRESHQTAVPSTGDHSPH